METAKPKVTLQFLSGRHAFSSEREVERVVRHRYTICWYVVGVSTAAFLHDSFFFDGEAGLELAISSISLFVFMTVAVLYIRLWVWMAGETDHVTVWMPPGLLLAAIMAHPVADVSRAVTLVQPDMGLPSWVVVLGVFGLAEVAIAVALRRLVPRVQRAVRAGHDAFAALTEDWNGPELVFGKVRIACGDVLRAEANGNTVQIVTRDRRQIVPGPFAAVLAQLPTEAGCRVHRSHWVAAAAVRAVERCERQVRLVTVQGDTVPVAQPLSTEVAGWLERLPVAGAMAEQEPQPRAGQLNLASLLN